MNHLNKRHLDFRRLGISVETHPKYRPYVTFYDNGVFYETTVKKVKTDYFTCFGRKHYFDKVKNLQNYMTGENITKEMLYRWFI